MAEADGSLPGLTLPVDHIPVDSHSRFPVIIEKAGEGPAALKDLISAWSAATLTRREVCMLRFVEEITNKPEWWLKVHDPEITAKWKREAVDKSWRDVVTYDGVFTSDMADACISELQKKAEIYDKTGLIPVMDTSACAIKSDTLLGGKEGKALVSELKRAVASLENVPDEQKDWHPNSKNQVLDLVHPSLYPLIYGRTRILLDKCINFENALDYCGAGTVLEAPHLASEPTPYVSNKFQWLPCDVQITEGRAKIDSYINNLHPKDHAGLYSIIERFIEKSLPAWDLVYRWPMDIERAQLERMDESEGWESAFDIERIRCREVSVDCGAPECQESEYGCSAENRPVNPGEPGRDDHYQHTDEFRRRDNEWYEERHPLKMPEPDRDASYFKLEPSHVRTSGFFGDASRLQVIVKLANIHLTPEDPTYEGGSWHVEGLINEHICSTALFYYDSENITDCHLDFRCRADREELMMELSYEQSDFLNIMRTFAIDPDDETKQQTIGSVLTREGRALFFPNIYQHHVSPFRLADPSKPGHRKILALFLVDPAIPVISTANIPPQQREWWSRQIDLSKSQLGMVPPELREQMLTDDALPMGDDEAKALRLELMAERTVLQEKGQEAMAEWGGFNFCEH